MVLKIGRVILYEFNNNRISIHIEAKIVNGDLVVEGYDIGKTVEDAWGDSDYEYVVIIKKKDINSFCAAMKIDSCKDEEIQKAISKKFKGNKCFSKFNKFLDSNNIKYEGFSWT